MEVELLFRVQSLDVSRPSSMICGAPVLQSTGGYLQTGTRGHAREETRRVVLLGITSDIWLTYFRVAFASTLSLLVFADVWNGCYIVLSLRRKLW